MSKTAKRGYLEDKSACHITPSRHHKALLAWYDKEQRLLPWRARRGQRANPYHVWLSEIMLQQTVVKTVIPYFETFIALWPTIEELAASDLEEVRRAWAGLGYYSRAANLHRCARLVVRDHEGEFPKSVTALEKLPGIGPYTAAAIAAIAFSLKATPVDGNIERVMARLFAEETPLPGAKKALTAYAQSLTPNKRPGDYAQALMDLGAMICTPKNPSCSLCPLNFQCLAHKQGLASQLPYRQKKKPKPQRRAVAFLAVRDDGKILLRRRAEGGLLSGMLEVPSTEWQERSRFAAKKALQSPPINGEWVPVYGLVEHTFTHFQLALKLYRLKAGNDDPLTGWAQPERCCWVDQGEIAGQALPSVMMKLIRHGLNSWS